MWCTDPHESTGQATPTLGAGQPVGGDLCLELVGPAAGPDLVNQTTQAVFCDIESYSVTYFAYARDQKNPS